MSPYTNIYLDLVFLINFSMDFMILWAAAKLGRINVSWKGLFWGSVVGASYTIMLSIYAQY